MKVCSLVCLLILCFTTAVLRAEEPANFEVGAFSFKRPAAWGWVPASGMRKAQLSVPGKDRPADITFFHFGSGGMDDVTGNVQRWYRQFQGAAETQKTEEQTIGNTKVVFVSAEGTFNGAMPGQAAAPMENYALQGAILQHAGGNVFVKMTGPKELIQSTRQQFMDFVAEAAKAAQ